MRRYAAATCERALKKLASASVVVKPAGEPGGRTRPGVGTRVRGDKCAALCSSDL